MINFEFQFTDPNCRVSTRTTETKWRRVWAQRQSRNSILTWPSWQGELFDPACDIVGYNFVFCVCVCVCFVFLDTARWADQPCLWYGCVFWRPSSEQDCIQCILHLNSKIAKWSANLQGDRKAEREFKGRGWWWGPGRPLLDCGCDTNLIFAPSCLTETRSCFKMCFKLKQKPAENWIVNTLVGNKSDKTKNIVVTAEIMK